MITSSIEMFCFERTKESYVLFTKIMYKIVKYLILSTDYIPVVINVSVCLQALHDFGCA